MKALFVFDLDGTLVDTQHVTALVLEDMFASRGAQAQKIEQIGPLLSHGGLAILQILSSRFGGDPRDYLSEFRSRLADLTVAESLVFPGIRKLLQAATEAGITLAINTNKPTGLARKTLKDTALLPFFGFVQGSEEQLSKKPELDHMRVICDRLGYSFRDIVFFGDSEVDQETACNAGIEYVHFSFGYGEVKAEFTPPALEFDELVDGSIVEIMSRFRHPTMPQGSEH